MIYSVWSHANRRYDYYRTPDRTDAVNSPSPSHLLGSDDDIGVPPEEAAWPLPADAVLVGSGKDPKGCIASTESGTGRMFEKPLVLFGVGVALAYLIR